MFRSSSVLSACAATVLAGGATLTFGAGPAAAAPSAIDNTFVVANEQTNLAEITIGTLALQRATSAEARDLATMTVADHRAAKAKVETLASGLGITLPTEPNAQQQQQAALLQGTTGSAFDVAYAQVQVAGHTVSIANTNTELSGGTDQTVKDYATYYLPVATHHLEMAQSAVSALGGTPGVVPAGTGGFASTTSHATRGVADGLVGVGVVALIGAGVVFARRRRLTT